MGQQTKPTKIPMYIKDNNGMYRSVDVDDMVRRLLTSDNLVSADNSILLKDIETERGEEFYITYDNLTRKVAFEMYLRFWKDSKHLHKVAKKFCLSFDVRLGDNCKMIFDRDQYSVFLTGRMDMDSKYDEYIALNLTTYYKYFMSDRM